MPNDTEQPGDDEQGERPRRRRTRDDEETSGDYKKAGVKGFVASFRENPNGTHVLVCTVVVIIGMGAIVWFTTNFMGAQNDKMWLEISEARIAAKAEALAQRGHDDLQLQKVLDHHKEQNQRLVDHMKFLSDAVTRMTNQQTVNFGYDRTGLVGDVARKLLDPKGKNNELHTGAMRGTGSPAGGSAGGESGDRSGADSSAGGVDVEPDRD
jgi:hypothetical protein